MNAVKVRKEEIEETGKTIALIDAEKKTEDEETDTQAHLQAQVVARTDVAADLKERKIEEKDEGMTADKKEEEMAAEIKEEMTADKKEERFQETIVRITLATKMV